MEKSDESIAVIDFEEAASAQVVKSRSTNKLSFLENTLRSIVRQTNTSNQPSLIQINDRKTAMLTQYDSSLKINHFLPHHTSTSTLGKVLDPSTHSATLPRGLIKIGASGSALLGDHLEINNSDLSSDDGDDFEEIKENRKTIGPNGRVALKSVSESQKNPLNQELGENKNKNAVKMISRDTNIPYKNTSSAYLATLIQEDDQKAKANRNVENNIQQSDIKMTTQSNKGSPEKDNIDNIEANAINSDDEDDMSQFKPRVQGNLSLFKKPEKRMSKNNIENMPIKEGVKAVGIDFSRGKDQAENFVPILVPDASEADSKRILKQNTNNLKCLAVSTQKRQESLKLAKQNTSEDDTDPFDLLIKAIFAHDIKQVERILNKNPTLNLNRVDKQGNTPLMLASKLAFRHLDYFEIAETLLEKGADARIRDKSGWTCVDEAVGQSDAMLLSLLFDYLILSKQKVLKEQQLNLIKVLDSMPNFYLEMKWDFDSSVLPFISKIAPSDTFKIWKFGKYLRMDNTLVGFKKLKVKRRNMSLIFNPDIPQPQNCKSQSALFSLNRSKNTYTNLLEEIDIEEKKNIMVDLMKADPLQGTFNIKDCQFSESKGLFSSSTHHKISGYETIKYDFKVSMEYAVFKKSQAFFKETYQTYMEKMNAESPDLKDSGNPQDPKTLLKQMKEKNPKNGEPSNKGQASDPSKSKQLKDVINIERLQQKALNVDTVENAKVSEKKGSASIWFAKNFPLQIKDLLQAIQFLSKGNDLLQKMESLLSKKEVKDMTADGTFPMKLQLPITMSIKANITMTKYEALNDINVKDIFFVPEDLTYMPRKEAQKTLLRKKKRLLLFGMQT